MKTLVSIVIFFFLSCQTKKTNLFESLENETDVEIYLIKYRLDSVPSDIRLLKEVKRLYINSDTTKVWTIYPPLSARGTDNSKPPFRHLPEEITELTKLQSLTLVNLNLVTLPDSISKFKNLDTLILFMNKLTVANEIEKIKKLSNLKYLGILGNNITANDLIELKKSNPGLTINPELR